MSFKNIFIFQCLFAVLSLHQHFHIVFPHLIKPIYIYANIHGDYMARIGDL